VGNRLGLSSEVYYKILKWNIFVLIIDSITDYQHKMTPVYVYRQIGCILNDGDVNPVFADVLMGFTDENSEFHPLVL
jgi:hypothetical protein